MQQPRFIHLRLHSAFSLLEGAIHPQDLPGLCRQGGMPAVAVTDTNNLFAALEFSVGAAKAGIQPIIGCQLSVAADSAQGAAPVVLLVQDETGYRNLMALATAVWLDSGGGPPQVALDRLETHAAGLICLTGGADGLLGQRIAQGRAGDARDLARRLASAFPGRLYVELQRHPDGSARRTPAQAATEPGLVALAYDLHLPLVATNDVHFATRDQHQAHDALLCIADSTYVDQAAPRRRLTPDHHFKSQDDMAALFADLPEAVANTVEIARRCSFRVPRRDPILPRFAENEVEELRAQAREGLDARLAATLPAAPPEDYRARLDFELSVIEKMGFPGYFLIVADFIKWAKAQGIPVGPGRGSGAGSVVAWALTITDLDPIRYGLLFERFLNPERVSMPDFDIDFCMDRREEVIAYVQGRYGRDRVAQIITFGALLSKAAVRDVGRVLQMPYGQVDRLSKLIPVEGVKPVSIDKALATEPRLREEAAREDVVARMLDIAGNLEGLYRNASTHAAGVVIGDRPLVELVPLYQDPRSDMPATQFNMKWVEAAGLVKFDFLGLKTLTVIKNAVDLLAARGVAVDINAIPLDDERTYALYARADTAAVFQVESDGMKSALVMMRPTCIEDIIALVALYRPGPMENIPKFCKVKNGLEPRSTIHPLIDPILDETQGIIVYQEQVMEIARRMAGYSLGGADKLRRAMGKKIREEMEAERPKFVDGALANGVDATLAGEVFDLLQKFADYGFNKSHAAAYALVSYQTAWLKANHPVEFMAAVMNCDIHLTDKLSAYVDEAKKRLKIDILPPCVNRSGATFTVQDGRIPYALGALKNIGVDAMRMIEKARAAGGPFASVFDLARRVDLRRIGKRPFEMLARAGALDALDRNRRRLVEGADMLLAWSGAAHDERASAQVSLWGEGSSDLPAPRLPVVDDWSITERLAQEFAAAGFYLSGHPLDDWMPALRRHRVPVLTLVELAERARQGPQTVRIAGTVGRVQLRKSARGNRFAFVAISDPSGVSEVTVFSDTLERHRDLLETGRNLVLTVEAEVTGDQVKLLARSVSAVEEAAADAPPAGLRVFVAESRAFGAIRSVLDQADAAARRAARGPVVLVPMLDLPGTQPGTEVEVRLPGGFPVSPQVMGALKSLPGVVTVTEF
jgi:DNA polymerase-3 subunit alpha